MDAREMDNLVQRLVHDPHDEEVLAYAHQAGQVDPRSYAMLLEKVGQTTPDPAYAAHWLTQAANVWSQTLGDAHNAARSLMQAIEKEPTKREAVESLAGLYREKGDRKALVALLERTTKALGPAAAHTPEGRDQLCSLHEELGRLWSEPPLSRPERALENWKRLAELDAQNAYAIYAARELMKAQQMYADAVPFFAMEQALIDDLDRKIALYRDEADIRLRAGQGPESTAALRAARHLRPDDVALAQELGVNVVARLEAGEMVGPDDREEAKALFVSLAEQYDGEYGLSYATSALRCVPGDDRAMQLADHYGKQLGRTKELSTQYAAYVAANPGGFMAGEARKHAGSRPPPPPPRSTSPSIGGGRGAATPVPPRATEDSIELALEALEERPAPAPAVLTPVHGTPAVHFAPTAPPPSADGEAASGEASARADSRPDATPVPSGVSGPSFSQGDLSSLLEQAASEAQKGRKPAALAKYRDALKLDPANSEALAWVEDHLRQKRMYAELRDVLLAASRVTSQSVETRKAQLRDVAGLCESQLRDLDTAAQACRQIVQLDRGDEQAREQLRRLLERGQRWDELATLLEQEAMGAPDVEAKIALERKLAGLHEQKRKDPGAAAEAWARIASLSPQDEAPIQTAVKLFEKADQTAQAAAVLADNVGGIDDKTVRGNLLVKLGELRTKLDENDAAADAYAEAAEALGKLELWEQAEAAYVRAERWAEAANAVEQRATVLEGAAAEPKKLAALAARAAEHFGRAGDPGSAVEKLQRATELDPTDEQLAAMLADRLREENRLDELVTHLLARAEKVSDRAVRVASRKQAAALQREMGDVPGAKDTLVLVLSDGEDEATLRELVADAEQRSDHQEHAEFLRRLAAVVADPAEKIELLLREAKLVADQLDDPAGAIERYETLAKLSPGSRETLRAIADLHAQRDDAKGEADAVERELAALPPPPADGSEDPESETRVELAQRLARLYEGPLDDVRGAIRALAIVHAADPEDFDAVSRLMKASEQVEDWPQVARFLAALIEVEGDDDEASQMTRRLSEILADKLEKSDEALAVLGKLADQGDEPSREAYVVLGDRLGWKGLVATKLVEWYQSSAGPRRTEALRQAFDRFVAVGRDQDAAGVGCELARGKNAPADIGPALEEIATRIGDTEALGTAHDLIVRDKTGLERAQELVRQAEVQVAAGVDPLEAMQHGESALASVPLGDVEPLLARLAALTSAPGHAIDLYERQVGRCRTPADRLAALARAAQVAALRGSVERARGFFEIALGGGVAEDTIVALEEAARRGDEAVGATDPAKGRVLRTILAEALAAGGQGSRDGGRTRAALLRRASVLAHRELGDVDRAFQWIGDALVTLVDDATLTGLDQLGDAVGDPRRVEATLSRALEEVFDGPLVRRLLSKRAKMRRDVLGDRQGAAVDLKRLHDLAPADQDVMNDLSALLQELGDHRGMIQLYEDQILRGRDPGVRAELARKVAKLWEEEIGDSREAADAWRRVLRMRAGDAEATDGLERAKANKLRRSQVSLEREAREGLGGAATSPSAPPRSTASAPPVSVAPATTPSAPPSMPRAPLPSSPTMADAVPPAPSARDLEAPSTDQGADDDGGPATLPPTTGGVASFDGSAHASSSGGFASDERLETPVVPADAIDDGPVSEDVAGPSLAPISTTDASDAGDETGPGLRRLPTWSDATNNMARPSTEPSEPGAAAFAQTGAQHPVNGEGSYGQPGHGQPGDVQAGYEQAGHAQPGYGQPAYGQPGYGQPGYAQPGYDPTGPAHPGYDQAGYAAPGSAQPGHGAADHGATAQPQPGGAAAYGQAGYEQGGYGQAGYAQHGYTQAGHEQAGHQQAGHHQVGHEQAGHHQVGHDPTGHAQGGYAQGGYEQHGYPQHGYGQPDLHAGYASAQPGHGLDYDAGSYGQHVPPAGYDASAYGQAPAAPEAPRAAPATAAAPGDDDGELVDDDVEMIEDVDDAELIEDDDAPGRR